MNIKTLKETARAYALKNALAYGGKANQGAVVSGLFAEGLKKEDMGKFGKEISEVVKAVNGLSLEDQKKEFEKLKGKVSEREVREGLPELPDVGKKGVVMRFAPSASGATHIGHARTAALSFLYVQKYGGKFYIRIEDTNPENSVKEAYKMIKSEMNWLFRKQVEFVIQSERMELYYKYAEKLLKNNHAYVCTCSGDDFRNLAKAKQNCPCRDLNAKENLERWESMFDDFKAGEVVLRFRSDMKHPNPAMRDFPLARINEAEHVLQKKKYRVWPLMNLSVAVDDYEMGMTHIIRGKDHRDNAKRQELIYEALGWKKKLPWTGFIGRYKFSDLELSTTKTRQGIESGKYSGWDDPQLVTIASLKKKYKPETIWKFTEHTGMSEVDKTLDKKEFYKLLDGFEKA
jgi:glutamyl-tRNA synthetase